MNYPLQRGLNSPPGIAERKVDLCWSPVSQALMRPLIVIKRKITSQSVQQLRNLFIVLDIDLFILEGSPKSLDKDVVYHSATAVHTDVDAALSEHGDKAVARELRALISIEDVGLRKAQCLLQRLYAEVRSQGIGQLPGKNIATEPIHDCHKIHEAFSKRNIRYVAAPNLIRPNNRQSPQQIGINVMFRMLMFPFSPRMHGFQAHELHQTLYPLSVHLVPLSLQR